MMYCGNCGKELPDGTIFCTFCGARQINSSGAGDPNATENTENDGIRPPEIYIQPEPETSEESPLNNKKPKVEKSFPKVFLKVLIVSVLVIAFFSGMAILGYYTFLPAKPTLRIAEYFSVLKNYSLFDRSMAAYEEEYLKPVYEGTVRKDTELSLSADRAFLESGIIPPETVDLVDELLKKISIDFGYASDVRNKKETVYWGLNYMNNPALAAHLFLNDTRFGLGVPELTQKTVTGDFKDLPRLAEVFPDIPAELLEAYGSLDPWMSVRVYDEIKIGRKDIKRLMMDYSKRIIDSIDPDDMSIRREQAADVMGKEVKCQEITVSLDRSAQYKVIYDVLSRLRNDHNAYNLFCGNLMKLAGIMKKNRMVAQMLQDIDVEEALSKSNYEKYITDAMDSLDETGFPRLFEASIYINGLDVIKYAFRIHGETSADDVSFAIENAGNGKSFGFGSADGAESFHLTVAPGETPESKDKIKYTMDITFKTDAYEQGRISLGLEGTKTRSSKSLVTSSEYTGDLAIDIPGQFPEPMDIGFTAVTDIGYGDEVIIPDTGTGDVLDIAAATREDYDALMSDIYEKLGLLLTMLAGM